MADTIPKASEDEFRAAFNGLLIQADAHNVDRSPEFMAFIQHIAEVSAQGAAEIRWCRNIINKMTIKKVK